MKSFAVHYMNKYPRAKVDFGEDYLDVVDDSGKRISLRTGGNGQLIDRGHDCGASDRHDLSPIPKNARVFKLYPDGRVGKSEEAAARAAAADLIEVHGKILSIEEYRASSDYSVDEKGNVTPVVKVAPIAPVETPQA